MSAYYVFMDIYFFVHFTQRLAYIGNGLSAAGKSKARFQAIIFFTSIIMCLIQLFKIFNSAFLGIFENIETWCMIDATAILFMNDFILNAFSLLNHQKDMIDESSIKSELSKTAAGQSNFLASNGKANTLE